MFRLLADLEIALKFHLSQSNATNLWEKKSRGVPLYFNIFFERKTALTSGSLDDKNLKNKYIIHNCKFRHVSKPDIEAKCPNISTIQCISKPNLQIRKIYFFKIINIIRTTPLGGTGRVRIQFFSLSPLLFCNL